MKNCTGILPPQLTVLEADLISGESIRLELWEITLLKITLVTAAGAPDPGASVGSVNTSGPFKFTWHLTLGGEDITLRDKRSWKVANEETCHVLTHFCPFGSPRGNIKCYFPRQWMVILITNDEMFFFFFLSSSLNMPAGETWGPTSPSALCFGNNHLTGW